MGSTPTRRRLVVSHLPRERCESWKVAWDTRAEALDGAERGMEAGRVSPGCHLTPYRCERCGRWHIRNHRIVPLPPEDLSRRAGRQRRPWGRPPRRRAGDAA